MHIVCWNVNEYGVFVIITVCIEKRHIYSPVHTGVEVEVAP